MTVLSTCNWARNDKSVCFFPSSPLFLFCSVERAVDPGECVFFFFLLDLTGYCRRSKKWGAAKKEILWQQRFLSVVVDFPSSHKFCKILESGLCAWKSGFLWKFEKLFISRSVLCLTAPLCSSWRLRQKGTSCRGNSDEKTAGRKFNNSSPKTERKYAFFFYILVLYLGIPWHDRITENT